MAEHEAGKVGVKSFVARDQLVRERQTWGGSSLREVYSLGIQDDRPTWHQAAFLQPENGGETSGKEDSLHSGKCDNSLAYCVVLQNNIRISLTPTC